MLAAESCNAEDWKEFENEFKLAKEAVEKLYLETLYSEKNDNCDALIELHSGADRKSVV